MVKDCFPFCLPFIQIGVGPLLSCHVSSKKRFPHKVYCFYVRKKKYFDQNVLLESTNGYNYPIQLIKICDQNDISDTLINFFISLCNIDVANNVFEQIQISIIS